jgi:hypothetical protein
MRKTMNQLLKPARPVPGTLLAGKEREYWLERLSGELVKTSFPYDYRYRGGIEDRSQRELYPFRLPAALSAQLNRLANHSPYNLFMVLLAAVVGLLHRHSGSMDIITSIPIYRQQQEGEFLNTVLVVRSRLTPVTTFKELLIDVKNSVLAANENVNYPIEKIDQFLEIPW